ncbi:MAG: hypothetical protein LBG11_00600, partial [Bifidobacteriaceae bacterium]|nr:hypothetical protein [Bifidobacteriaceae bacterium]
GSRLSIIPGMGHELPRTCWPLIARLLTDNGRRAAARADGDYAPSPLPVTGADLAEPENRATRVLASRPTRAAAAAGAGTGSQT